MHFRASARALVLLAVIFSAATQYSCAQPDAASVPAASPRIAHEVPPAHPSESQVPDTVLVWDSLLKETITKVGDTDASFTFSVTNISTQPVVIDSVTTSCGCTVAKLPATPWILQPGSNGQLQTVMDLKNKTGTLTKAVTIHSDKGEKTLLVRASVGQGRRRPAGVPIPLVGTRDRNQQLAKADRQAVFRGDCARCHAEPGRGKTGEPLYAAACGICHDAEHRADSVPDLHHLDHETDPSFWRRSILHGKTDSMMPAFALDQGGPLSPEQVNSLVDFLQTHYSRPSAPASNTK